MHLFRYLSNWLSPAFAQLSEGLPSILALVAINAVLFADIVAMLAYLHSRQFDKTVEFIQREYNATAFLDGWLIGYMLSALGWYSLGKRDRWQSRVQGARPLPPPADDYMI